MYVCIYIHMYYTHIDTYVIHKRTSIHTYIYTHINTCMQYIPICIKATLTHAYHTHICMYVLWACLSPPRVHMYTHEHTRMYTYVFVPPWHAHSMLRPSFSCFFSAGICGGFAVLCALVGEIVFLIRYARLRVLKKNRICFWQGRSVSVCPPL